MRSAINAIYGICFVAVLSTVVVMTTIILLCLPGLQRRRRVAQISARAVFRIAAMPIHVSGHALTDAPAVIVANHASYLDGVVMFAVMPTTYSFIIKREMNSVPFVNLLLRRLGMKFVERFDRRRSASDARKLMRAACEGQHLAAFPEGTFRREPGLGRFHGGAFRAAVSAGTEVIPVTIQGTRHILPEGRYLPLRGKIRIHIHPSVSVDPTGGRPEIRRIRDAARRAILSELDEPDLLADPH